MEIYRRAPTPRENEHPKVYADRIGQWYATLVPEKHEKSFGQYLTLSKSRNSWLNSTSHRTMSHYEYLTLEQVPHLFVRTL